MKKLLTFFLFLPFLAFSQSSYTVTNTSLIGNCLTPDTLVRTTIVTGKSGYFSSKVTLSAVTSQVTKVYKPPVVTPPPNIPPTVTISGTARITEPVSTVTLTAASSDPDGTVTKILWEKKSGSALTIYSPSGNPTLIGGLAAGNYVISATVTDDKGATATASFTITVIGVSTTPPTNPDPPPVTSTNPNPTSTPFMQSGFEGSDATAGFNSYAERPNPGDLSITTTEKHSGNSSARFHINQNDVKSTGHKRVELTLLPDPKRPFKNEPTLGEGSEIYVRFFLKIKEPFVKDREFSIFQMHHNSSTGSPPCALYLTGGNFGWDFKRTANGDEHVDPITPYKIGVWQEITIHLKFSSTDSGLSEVWVDGVHYENKGANLYPNVTNYTKVGPYEWIMALTPGMNNIDQTFYIDDFAYWLIK